MNYEKVLGAGILSSSWWVWQHTFGVWFASAVLTSAYLSLLACFFLGCRYLDLARSLP